MTIKYSLLPTKLTLQERLTPKEAMEHPYFKPVREREGVEK